VAKRRASFLDHHRRAFAVSEALVKAEARRWEVEAPAADAVRRGAVYHLLRTDQTIGHLITDEVVQRLYRRGIRYHAR